MPAEHINFADPNLDHLYLHDMIGPDHPAYQHMKDRYAGTPEGKRIEGFREENAKYRDGLQGATLNKLDNLINSEGVLYTGDPADRISKIRAVRLHRSRIEDEKIKRMTPAERKVYLEDAEKMRAEAEKAAKLRVAEDPDRQARKDAERSAKRAAWEEARYQAKLKREEQIARNRQMLDEERERRKDKPDPVAARKAAVDEREKQEKELAEQAETDDAPTSPANAPQSDEKTGKAPSLKEQEQKQAKAAAARKQARKVELAAMNKAKLDDLMNSGKLEIKANMTNAQKAQSILDAEFPVK